MTTEAPSDRERLEANVPACLRERQQWVAWRYVDDQEANSWLDYEHREGYELPSF